MQELERAVKAEGQVLLGWRDVPVDAEMPMSPTVRKGAGDRQIFVARGPDVIVPDALERKLYVIRKTASGGDPGAQADACPALVLRTQRGAAARSSTKGLLLADQVGSYRDLQDPRCRFGVRAGAPALLDQHLPRVAARAPVPHGRAQREISTVAALQLDARAPRAWMKSPCSATMKKLYPISFEGQSDTATFDNALSCWRATTRSRTRR